MFVFCGRQIDAADPGQKLRLITRPGRRALIPIHCRYRLRRRDNWPNPRKEAMGERRDLAGNWVKLPNGSATETVRPLAPRIWITDRPETGQPLACRAGTPRFTRPARRD